MYPNINKNRYISQLLIVLSVLGFCFICLAILQEMNFLQRIVRNIVDLIFALFVYIFFCNFFSRFEWSKKAKLLSLIPIGLITIDCLLNIVHSISAFDEIPVLGKNSSFARMFDESFLILTILSLLAFFTYLISELEHTRLAFVEQSKNLKSEIDRRQRIEKRRRHEQQDEIVGQLAGGIAHEFNNILTIIIGNLSIAVCHVEEKHRSYLDKSLASAERASDLVSELLSFSRREQMEFSQVQLENILEQYCKIANQDVDKTIQIQFNNEPNLPPINANESKIFLILMQLTRNANEAILAKRKQNLFQEGEQGIILFDLKRVTVTQDDINHMSLLKEGSYIVLTIRDNGIGISKENQSRLFLPFFTTKEVGEGVGLDLAEVKGTVEQHNGSIRFSSQENVFTEFKIFFPAEDQ